MPAKKIMHGHSSSRRRAFGFRNLITVSVFKRNREFLWNCFAGTEMACGGVREWCRSVVAMFFIRNYFSVLSGFLLNIFFLFFKNKCLQFSCKKDVADQLVRTCFKSTSLLKQEASPFNLQSLFIWAAHLAIQAPHITPKPPPKCVRKQNSDCTWST